MDGHARTGILTPRGHDRLDEDDVRVRPGRGSRPRTRRRPAHESATLAFVTSVDRGRYGCMTGGGLVVAMKARELGRGSVVVGDRVALAGDVSGGEGTLARIVRVEPRVPRAQRPGPSISAHTSVKSGKVLATVCALATRMPGTARPSTAAAITMRWSSYVPNGPSAACARSGRSVRLI